MIQRIDITGQRTEVTPELKKYIERKIGRLDRYVSRHARESIHAEVRLRESKASDKKQFTCTVTLHLPNEVIEASEQTINMFAAVDIVETKLKQQLKKYKELHSDAKMRRTIFGRFRRKNPTIG